LDLAVAENEHPAKFRIAATLATDIDPATSSEEALWGELDRLMPTFLASWRTISAGASLPEAAEGPSLLELCRELTYRMRARCPVRRQAYLSKIRASRRCQGTTR